MMSPKHYQEIADAFAGVGGRNSPESAHYTLAVLAHDLANVFEKDNPMFNREYFLAACNVPTVRHAASTVNHDHRKI